MLRAAQQRARFRDKVDAMKAEKKARRQRARKDGGQFLGDDPKTPDVNEAWVEKEEEA